MRPISVFGIAIVLSLAVISTGCGSDTGDNTANTATTSPAAGTDNNSTGSDAGSGSSDSTSYDCAALQASLKQLGTTTVQLLPQLKSAQQWKSIASGAGPRFDLDAFAAGVEGLRPLESLPVNGAKVKTGLDAYAEAAALAQEAQGSADPAGSDAGKQLIEATADVQTFIFHQSNIAIAFDEAGCSTN